MILEPINRSTTRLIFYSTTTVYTFFDSFYRNFSISPGKSYFATIHWIPAFAGMTENGIFSIFYEIINFKS